MTAELSAVVGFTSAAAVAFAATPVAIKVAEWTDFYDRPREYRQHGGATPFLGGAAVLLAFLIAAAAVGAMGVGRLLVIIGGAIVMFVLGTVDDLIAVAPKWRVLATAGAALALYAAGIGWNTAAPDIVDVALTVLWVVGLVNALNLMDNLDGACSSVAATAAIGIGVLAAIKGDAVVAGLAFAVAGACSGFLPWNLTGPAKIFLGDGGSMPLGFLVAALAMATCRHAAGGNAGLLVGALLVGLPILDVTLVSVSRTRRGVSITTGGRDHLTHRMLLALSTPRRVAGALAVAQLCLCALAIVGYELGAAAVFVFAFSTFVLGVIAVLVLDMEHWRPDGIASASQQNLPEPGNAPVQMSVDAG